MFLLCASVCHQKTRFAGSWYKHRYKLGIESARRPGRSHDLGSVLPGHGHGHGQREHRQSFDRPVHVEKSRVGVDVRREFWIAMAHRGLSSAERNSRHAQMRPESCSQSVNVERPASVINLRDPGGFKVAVKNLHQCGGNVEEWFVRR